MSTNSSQCKKERGPEYGTPVAGTKTAQRGHQAHNRISNEIIQLCTVIDDNGETTLDQGSNPVKEITFGQLFDIYTHISNKVVGILLRARKYGLVDFEGEMLYQRRDDDVIIRLIATPDKARAMAKEGEEDFEWGKCMWKQASTVIFWKKPGLMTS